MNQNKRLSSLKPYTSPYPDQVEYEKPFLDMAPNAIGDKNRFGERCSTIWYRMKGGSIYQYSYVPRDEINHVLVQKFQKHNSMMNDLVQIYQNGPK